MSREKQIIEEMAHEINRAKYMGSIALQISEHLYNAGYRKQSVGEWEYIECVYFCSECGYSEEFRTPNYCPNCGAKMKGGAI